MFETEFIVWQVFLVSRILLEFSRSSFFDNSIMLPFVGSYFYTLDWPMDVVDWFFISKLRHTVSDDFRSYLLSKFDEEI